LPKTFANCTSYPSGFSIASGFHTANAMRVPEAMRLQGNPWQIAKVYRLHALSSREATKLHHLLVGMPKIFV
jgi:hypothetical protein